MPSTAQPRFEPVFLWRRPQIKSNARTVPLIFLACEGPEGCDMQI
jgi:hypothetical protein